MIEIELDGQKMQVPEGSTVMHAADAAGKVIPHFCYHKKLSIAANCRMCLVDIEKMPKPMPACATTVAPGMIVRTSSEKAVNAQKSVMEFLLINHPLDCPICDQGGECQLQDMAMGYGGVKSRYSEEKRVVFHKNVGPLISMEEMSRCIHCTRCVRFGQEVAGVMELGMSHRGEHSQIETFVGQSVDSELSGNMIDICPVGALTSKPFRYSARTWELSRRKSISPHDSTGTNLTVQVKGNQVMRVLPLENEAINECWIADRDRFSYEALNSEERLTTPMIKQDGKWLETDWATALEYVAHGFKDITAKNGSQSVGALLSPHSTVEELFLAKKLMQGLGSDNVDSRLRHADFTPTKGAHWLGMPIAALSNLQSVLVVGSHLRKDHPLFAQRIRQAARQGAKVCVIHSANEYPGANAWAMPIVAQMQLQAQQWVQGLAAVAAAIATAKGVESPVQVEPDESANAIAKALMSGERKAVLLGNAAAHHANAATILTLAQWIAQQTGATVGYLTEAANTVGAQLVGAHPSQGGFNTAQMLSGEVLKAVLLLNVEPEFDTAYANLAKSALDKAHMVVSLSPFKANMDVADVLLPIAPWTETSGSFINAEGRLQSFTAVVAPLGQTRPAWKVLRVLGSMLKLNGFEQETSQQVLQDALGDRAEVDTKGLSNEATEVLNLHKDTSTPCTAAIYQLDGIVRRAHSLQLTQDAKRAGQTAAARVSTALQAEGALA